MEMALLSKKSSVPKPSFKTSERKSQSCKRMRSSSSRPVWSFSSLSATKGQPRYPTTPGDGVESAIVYIMSKREEFTSKESQRGVLQRKQRLLLKWNRRAHILSFTGTPWERLILSPSRILMANEMQIQFRNDATSRKAGGQIRQILTLLCALLAQIVRDSVTRQETFLISLSGSVSLPLLGSYIATFLYWCVQFTIPNGMWALECLILRNVKDTAKVELLTIKKKICADMSVTYTYVYIYIYLVEFLITPWARKSWAQEEIPDFKRIIFVILLQKSL